jgi:uncharacterized protein (DUF362 family)
MNSTVAVVKTTPETVLEDIGRVMEQAGFAAALPADAPVILKNNISWHMPFLGANTTPWQLEGVIRTLRQHGYRELCCVQNRTVVTNPYKGERLNRYRPILRHYDVPVHFNFEPDFRWIRYEPTTPLLVLDRVFPDGIYIPEFFRGKSVVHLPTMKCHIYTTTTGAMKNAFGGLLERNRHWCHSQIHETLVDLLTIQREIHRGVFAVTDGTICGNGPGPRTMTPMTKGYVLASSDPVALDAVSSSMMGFDPLTIGHLRLAHERGLGTARLQEIEIVGEDIRGVNFGFHVGKNSASRVGGPLWWGPLRHLQWLFFRTSLVYFFIYASYIYHDWLWWQLVGKRRMRALLRTPWGQLWESYPAAGDLPAVRSAPRRRMEPVAQ